MRLRRYPGRDRVVSREDARDVLWRSRVMHGTVKHPCLSPIDIHSIGLPSFIDGDDRKLPVVLQARCRKCAECLAHRRRLWTARGVAEISAARRTWFGTLTVRPEDRFVLRMKADARTRARRREPLSNLSAADQFAAVATELQREATKWLKRVRQQAGGPSPIFARGGSP